MGLARYTRREHDTTSSRRRAGTRVADIQRHHPELPDLAAPESLIGESSSACGHELSFERLLHEAVHGIAAARGVRDTSRAGRYHNRRFLAIAEELGLDHAEDPHPSSGFSLVTMNAEARRRYRPRPSRLQRALKAHLAATATDTKRSFRGPAARHGSSGGASGSRPSANAGAMCGSSPPSSHRPHHVRCLQEALPDRRDGSLRKDDGCRRVRVTRADPSPDASGAAPSAGPPTFSRACSGPPRPCGRMKR